jgi:hypothetical protein
MTHPTMPASDERRLSDLRARIQRGEYPIDSRAVAEAFLARQRRRARRLLRDGARTRAAGPTLPRR